MDSKSNKTCPQFRPGKGYHFAMRTWWWHKHEAEKQQQDGV